MYYLIKDLLLECTAEDIARHEFPYVAVVTKEEFQEKSALFDLGVDMEIEYEDAAVSKIEVNYDSLTGTFYIPDRADLTGDGHGFAYALDEKGIVFINDDGTAQSLIDAVRKSRKWRNPSLERFIYDFLERMVSQDLPLFEKYEDRLGILEDRILEGDMKDIVEDILDIRTELGIFHTHYEQLLDLCQELLENENNFFKVENLRYFEMFSNRVDRLNDIVSSLRERAMQVRDLHDSQLNVRQNKISTMLAIIASIFLPLTLLVGWYGMNFRYMPELEYRYSYPILVGVCVLIVVLNIIFFKIKKWL